MAEVINLRLARKRAARAGSGALAAENRAAHGISKRERTNALAQREKANRTLDQHRIDEGDRR